MSLIFPLVQPQALDNLIIQFSIVNSNSYLGKETVLNLHPILYNQDTEGPFLIDKQVKEISNFLRKEDVHHKINTREGRCCSISIEKKLIRKTFKTLGIVFNNEQFLSRAIDKDLYDLIAEFRSPIEERSDGPIPTSARAYSPPPQR